MFAAIASRCAAMRGASAISVRSQFATPKPRAATQARDLAQEFAAVRAGVARVVRGEMPADVAERRRAEQRVHQRVQEDVAVRMGDEAPRRAGS